MSDPVIEFNDVAAAINLCLESARSGKWNRILPDYFAHFMLTEEAQREFIHRLNNEVAPLLENKK